MRIPKDWDKPSPDNDDLCELFEIGKYGQMPYRIHIPFADGKVPLVVYLHGADAMGTDNVRQLSIHDIGTMFARESWRMKHPAFILAPQCTAGTHWGSASSAENVYRLISEILNVYEDIDRDRIYIYGYSAGAAGVYRILKAHPGFFAGAMPICGATTVDGIDALLETPIWMFHAADDEIVRVTYAFKDDRENGFLGSRDISERFADNHSVRYTEYPAGFMKEKYGVNPHCSWVAVAEDEKAKEWLFSNRNS